MGTDIDWVDKGMVTTVQDQGGCGSCWAFSAVAVVESWFLMQGKKTKLSEQQLVDCSKNYGNNGCNGGFNYLALAYIKDNGVTNWHDYPYNARN